MSVVFSNIISFRQFPTIDNFPAVGSRYVNYISQNNNNSYRWDIASQTYIQIGGGASFPGITVPGVVFVSSAGNNATATRNRLDLPAQDIATAKTLAISGDTIVILSDLTNQVILNDDVKNLTYNFFHSVSISFVDDIVNITTPVNLEVYGANCIFTGVDVIVNNELSNVVFQFDTLNHSGIVQLTAGTTNIKGRLAVKNNTGIPFVFGYSLNQKIIEIQNWNSSSPSISYFTDASNTILQNSKLNFAGQIRANQLNIVSIANNFLIDNCEIICSFFEIGLNNTNSFRGSATFNKTKIVSTSPTKTTIQCAHNFATGNPTLVFNQDCILIPNVAVNFCLSNPATNPITVKLQGTLVAQKPINVTNINLTISGGAVLDSPNIQ